LRRHFNQTQIVRFQIGVNARRIHNLQPPIADQYLRRQIVARRTATWRHQRGLRIGATLQVSASIFINECVKQTTLSGVGRTHQCNLPKFDRCMTRLHLSCDVIKQHPGRI
jgi:hypothetical protein